MLPKTISTAMSRGAPVLWKGWKVIGCSLAVGPDGGILVKGPYGHDAQALITVNLQARPRDIKGESYGPYLKGRGYEGP
ncbi:MAG: hypothetical protein QXG97_06965 [Nitrososphaerota archaeon]